MQVKYSGQGRGRTADLPIFRTTVQCPSPIGTVRDLLRNVLATVGGRPRTNANETEIETTRGQAAREQIDCTLGIG